MTATATVLPGSRTPYAGSRIPSRVFLMLTLVLLAGLVPAASEAAARRLSEASAVAPEVFAVAASPDGVWAAYVQEAVEGAGRELWAKRIDGDDPPQLLSGPLPAGDEAESIAVSADSQRVVYIERRSDPLRRELYSVRFDNGVRTRLNPDLPTGAQVDSFRITPDGSRVIYRADQQVQGTFHLWSVPIAGGTSVRLAPSSVASGRRALGGFQVSPNGTHVVFRANYTNLSKEELFSAPVDGSDFAIRISSPLVFGGNVTSFQFRPSGTHVAYLADQDIDEVFEVFRVLSGGGNVLKLNPDLPAGRSVTSYAISPSGSRLVYIADQVFSNVFELFMVSFLGGTSTKLNPTPVLGGDVHELGITAASDYVVYLADRETDQVNELYSVPITGGENLKLHTPIANPDFESNRFWISPTGHGVVHRVRWEGNYQRLYRADVRVGMTSSLPLWPWAGAPEPNVGGVTITQDGEWVFFEARSVHVPRDMLYAAPMSGLAVSPFLVSSPSVSGGGNVGSLRLHPDDRRVVFRAELDEVGSEEVYIGDLCIFCDGFESGSMSRW